MTGVGAAVSTAEEYGEDGEEPTDDPGRQHHCSDRRRNIDAITAADHDGICWPVGVHVFSCCFQHHLQQSSDRRHHITPLRQWYTGLGLRLGFASRHWAITFDYCMTAQKVESVASFRSACTVGSTIGDAENAVLENPGQNYRGGKRGTGKRGPCGRGGKRDLASTRQGIDS